MRLNSNSSPLLLLQKNIIWAFENSTPYVGNTLKTAVDEGLVSSQIDLNCYDRSAPPKGPGITKCRPAEMRLSLKHLELLWSFIYGWFVLFEEGIQKPRMRNEYDAVDLSVPMLARARQLIDWAVSLQTTCTDYPPGLPSPLKYQNSEEQAYGETTNLAFQQAVAFLLGHEFAHANGGHLESIDKTTPNDEVIKAENEADNDAFERLIEQGYNDKDKLSKALAILMALVSSIYLGEERITTFRQVRHPNMDVRICNLMHKIDFQEKKNRDYFFLLASLMLDEALPEEHREDGKSVLYADAEEAFQATLDRIEKWARPT